MTTATPQKAPAKAKPPECVINTVVTGEGENRKVRRQFTAKVEDQLIDAGALLQNLRDGLTGEEQTAAETARLAIAQLLIAVCPAKRKTKS